MRCPPEVVRRCCRVASGARRAVPASYCRAPCCSATSRPTTSKCESVDWLERFLSDYTGTVVAITHDRYFLDNVAKWILELHAGKGLRFEGNYSSWLEQKQARLEQEGNEARRKSLARELEWVRMSPKARQSKGKARLHSRTDKLYHNETKAADPGRLEARDRESRTAPPWAGDRGGAGLSKGFGDRLLIEDLSVARCRRRAWSSHRPEERRRQVDAVQDARRAVSSPRTPARSRSATPSTCRTSNRVRDDLDPDATVFDEITGGAEVLEVRGRMGTVSSFNFKGTDHGKRVGDLSGGKRNRVHLAKLLKSGGRPAAAGASHQRPRRRHAAALEAGLESFPDVPS